MLRDEKILLTGPAGQIAAPLAAALARENEVWGIARFGDPAARERSEAVGVRTVSVDLAEPDLSAVPDDCTLLLHLAADQGSGDDADRALSVNAEAVGFLMHHCRRARAALVMSTSTVYRPHADPWHAFVETDPLGGAVTPWAPTYSMSKIAQEAVARQTARLLGLPTVIARMNASYGPGGGLPTYTLRALLAGEPVTARWDPCPYSPIHDDDIAGQVEALLDAAAVPATVVNWGGDEVVTLQEWTAFLAGLTGRPPTTTTVEVAGSHRGQVTDPGRRRALTGPCTVDWRTGLTRVVEAVTGVPAVGPAAPSAPG